MNDKSVEERIKEAREKQFYIGLYGMSTWGNNCGFLFADWLNLKVDFVADKDKRKLSAYEGKCDLLSQQELLLLEKDVLLLLFIGQYLEEEVLEELNINSHIHIITLGELTNLDIIVERFYDVSHIRNYAKERERKELPVISDIERAKKDRIAIYTCVVGEYDVVKEPQYIEENCDYYLISDREPEEGSVYQWINVYDIVPNKDYTPAEMNRYCKMHSYDIFNEYRYAIYVDGSITIINGIAKYIDDIGEYGLAMHKHSFIDCIYVEGIRMVGGGVCDYEEVKRQMTEYLLEGMPRNYGQFKGGLIVFDHNNAIGQYILKEWFKEYMEKAKRDQFSFSYVLWKNGYSVSGIGSIANGISCKKNQDIILTHIHATKRNRKKLNVKNGKIIKSE